MTELVGLIGLGFIGASIGERLTATGQPPIVYDVVAHRLAGRTPGWDNRA